jgi:hypothetical protein
VFDEPPEPADEMAVLDETGVLDEPPEPADETAVLDEPPPQAATSSTMPAVTARTPARRRAREWLLSP